MLKAITTEKAIKLVEAENTLVFESDRKRNKSEIKKEIEETFNVKVKKINTLIKQNKKVAYVKLDKKNPAIDIATKLGMM